MQNEIEKRFSAKTVTTQGRKIVGHAAVFGQFTQIGHFREVIQVGAFKRSLEARADVICLQDHDVTKLLGRTKSGTLRLSEDAIGLRYEIDVPDTAAGRDLLALGERGDLGGASFAFRAGPNGQRWNPDRSERVLSDVDLLDVSVITTFPAYAATTASVRALRPMNSAALRLRLLEIGGGQ